MFPTLEERYERYAAWCLILRVQPASYERWRQLLGLVPEYKPIAWHAHEISHA